MLPVLEAPLRERRALDRDGKSRGVLRFKPNTDETMCFLQTCRDAHADVQHASLVARWHPGFTGSGAGDDIAILTRGTGGAFSTRAGDPRRSCAARLRLAE